MHFDDNNCGINNSHFPISGELEMNGPGIFEEGSFTWNWTVEK